MTGTMSQPQAGSTPRVTGGREPRSVILGTAGHIDHGKTALVLALTGMDADRLHEEKARGITIDLGFASMDLVAPDGQAFEASLIDVPGHHAFVRNMLAGAGGIDAVMLVVAADEGVMPQTREHLQICSLLGIQHGLVVLSKADCVDPDRLLATRDQVSRLVSGSFLEDAPVLAVSAVTGQGIEALKASLAGVFARIPVRNLGRVTRLPVDRAFSIKGFGTVVTGTLQAGSVRAGDSPVLQPGNRKVRIRGLQVHGKPRAQIAAPNRVALNLPGMEVADIHRGAVFVPENTLEPVVTLDAQVELLPDVAFLRSRQRIRVHAFTSDSLGTVLPYPAGEADLLARKQMVRLRLARPMLLLPGDRFVLRHPSPAATLGGGSVLDAYPRENLKRALTAQWLNSLQRSDLAGQVLLRVQRSGSEGLSLSRLVRETGWTRSALEATTARLLAAGTLLTDAAKESLLSHEALLGAEQRLLEALLGSGDRGIALAELRSRLGLSEWVLSLAAKRLQATHRLEIKPDRLMLFREGTSGGAQRAMAEQASKVEQLYRAAGLGSPLVSEVAERLRLPPQEVRSHITGLLRGGKLVRLGSDALLVHRDPLQRLVAQLQGHRGERLDVGRFKDLTGLTRKHAIPLLEYLDGARVTRIERGVRLIL